MNCFQTFYDIFIIFFYDIYIRDSKNISDFHAAITKLRTPDSLKPLRKFHIATLEYNFTPTKGINCERFFFFLRTSKIIYIKISDSNKIKAN